MCRSVAAHADPTRYTTMDVVEDLEELRNRLGYDAVDLYGTSYGTRWRWHILNAIRSAYPR